MRLVLDTCVLVAAFRSHAGASRRLLDLVAEPENNLRFVASSALYLEYESVLMRPEHVAAHGLSKEKIEEFLILMASFTDPVRINFRYRPQLRDANDEMVLEAAINGGADAIVTHNMKDFLPEALRFGVEVLSPGRILNVWRKL